MPFFVYITTNPKRSTLYTGVTNNLEQRVSEHYIMRGTENSFAGKYYCYCLLYFESHEYINVAIEREKEIKSWSREKKEKLINSFNPTLTVLNNEIFGHWPPKDKLIVRNEE